METTIPSYYTARQSRDLIVAAHQQITRDWWNLRLDDFKIYVSQVVLDEAGDGEATMARSRVELVKPFPRLATTDAVVELARDLMKFGPLPKKAARDAAHIAHAAAHGMNFLLTWNCRHIANAEMMAKIREVCAEHGFLCPEICTPDELMGDKDEN